MALATRPKPTVHHKKRQAGHHRHSKHYLRLYWPYLPMLAIVGLGAYVNKLWAGGIPGYAAGRSALNSQLATVQPVTRVQALTGDRSGLVLVLVIIVTALAFAVFTWRHWRRLHRLVNKGEAFISRHPWLDVATVFVFTAGFILTRPNGLIT